MFGTITLKGYQEKNIFVSENGTKYKIINSWIIPPTKQYRFVLLQKYNEEYWYLIRSLNINI